MSSMSPLEKIEIPSTANFVTRGKGKPVILIHGVAASLHDWDFLFPELEQAGYAGYALDLLGHGDSPKPDSRAYELTWLFDHFQGWLDSLRLNEPPVLIGHSLGGYLALEYARRYPTRTRGLILVNPFFSRDQLPPLLRLTYRNSHVGGYLAHKTPEWLFRILIDLSSVAMGHSGGGLHAFPEEVRAQTALDYKRTAPGVYNVLNSNFDLTPSLSSISTPSLVLWGDRDLTLTPSSFEQLVKALPNARGESIRSGHVPHQANADWFNARTLEFLKGL
ncbi:MAG TPA: alpha/beta hydrolase [Anaerolineales bacterium]|nr:alpha/beta hydrolase [Anaerolineales bacterium]